MATQKPTTSAGVPETTAPDGRLVFTRAWSLIRALASRGGGSFDVTALEALPGGRTRQAILRAWDGRIDGSWETRPLQERRRWREAWGDKPEAPPSAVTRRARPLPLTSSELAAAFPEITADTAKRATGQHGLTLAWSLPDGREAYFMLMTGEGPWSCGSSPELARRAYDVGLQVTL